MLWLKLAGEVQRWAGQVQGAQELRDSSRAARAAGICLVDLSLLIMPKSLVRF